MTTPYLVQAPNFPIVGQLTPDSDGQPSPGTTFDCGEACVVAVVQYVHGITALSVEDVRRDLLRDATGPTTPEQLSAYLSTECNVPNTIYTPTTQASYLYRQWLSLKQGLPLIALRYWETIDSDFLHFCVIPQQTESVVTVMDPQVAAFVPESYVVNYAMAVGHATLIAIDRARDAGL